MATCRNATLALKVESTLTGMLHLRHVLRFQSGTQPASQFELPRHAQCPNSPVICDEAGYTSSSWTLDDLQEGNSGSHLRNHRHSVSEGLFLLYTDASHHQRESGLTESDTGAS
jgi:hypothetical protein